MKQRRKGIDVDKCAASTTTGPGTVCFCAMCTTARGGRNTGIGKHRTKLEVAEEKVKTLEAELSEQAAHQKQDKVEAKRNNDYIIANLREDNKALLVEVAELRERVKELDAYNAELRVSRRVIVGSIKLTQEVLCYRYCKPPVRWNGMYQGHTKHCRACRELKEIIAAAKEGD